MKKFSKAEKQVIDFIKEYGPLYKNKKVNGDWTVPKIHIIKIKGCFIDELVKLEIVEIYEKKNTILHYARVKEAI